jgi:hydroxymethylpyrimidine pyrophosphatase-like HAD family hydrolase
VHFSGPASRSNSPTDQVEHLLPYVALCELSETRLAAHRLTLSLSADQIGEMADDIAGTYYFVEDGRLEIYPPGSKWHGMMPLMRKYGISPAEVVTIGNGVNDIEMLEGAGLGIAMGNAPEHVKRAADWITKDNNNQGVTHALKSVFHV